MLRGLPIEYDALRVAFVTKGAVTMCELHEALRTKAKRVNPDCGLMGASGTYMLSARGYSRTRGQGKQNPRMREPPGSCYSCGKIGHIHKNCPTNSYVQSHMQSNDSTEKHMIKTAEYVCDE